MYDIAIPEGREDSKDAKIIEAIGKENAKPYVKKYEGLAVKVEEDKEVKFTDYDGHENVLKVPAGSIVKIMEGCSTEIVTPEDFDKKYVFHDEGEEVKEEAKEPAHKKSGPSITDLEV